MFQSLDNIVGLAEVIAPLLDGRGDLGVSILLEVVENVAVETLLTMSFTNRCLQDIFDEEHNVVPWNCKPSPLYIFVGLGFNLRIYYFIQNQYDKK